MSKKLFKRPVLFFLILIVISFLVVSVIWLIRYQTIFAPSIKSGRLHPDPSSHGSSYNNYVFTNDDVIVQVVSPKFLRFGGGFNVVTPTHLTSDGKIDMDKMSGLNCSVIYSAKLFGEGTFNWCVSDYTKGKEHGQRVDSTFILNDKLELIDSYPDQSGIQLVYEDYRESIADFYNKYFVEICGYKKFEKIG